MISRQEFVSSLYKEARRQLERGGINKRNLAAATTWQIKAAECSATERSERLSRANELTFMQRYASDLLEDPELELELCIEAWHRGDGFFQELHEYLGMSRKEYADWVMLKTVFK